ncbi:MAG TPA: OmpA family protein [Pirellulales bacterium]|nr:OmpA family protein [Pirellulales bacterium]
MRPRSCANRLFVWFLPLALGCAQNPYVLQGQLERLQQEHVALGQRYQELQARMTTLDQDNQEQGQLLAQSLQQRRVLEDQLTALQQQLSGTTTQLAKLKESNGEVEKKAEMYAASAKRKIGASISANSSAREPLPKLDLPGVSSRVDGDVIRVELPAGRLFLAGGAQLSPDASALLDEVSTAVARRYADQRIGIEGHTDSDPINNDRWSSNHVLSVARATAVYNYLAARSRINSSHLIVVGHGANHPLVSNATPAGKERNARIELVIYPERASSP